MSLSPALTLISEDELKKVIDGEKRFKHKQKLLGMIPRGLDSPFGDFSNNAHQVEGEKYAIAHPRKIKYITQGIPPPSTDIFQPREIKSTEFRKLYLRGDLPICVQHGPFNKVGWKVSIDSVEYRDYLPLFFEGLREKEEPFRFLAVQGACDLVANGTVDKILQAIPHLILPTKAALDTRDPEVIATICRMIQGILLVDGGSDVIGQALVPYLRQLLPTFNIFKGSNHNIGDQMEYSQRKLLCLGSLIHDTLHMIERYGGTDAFINIKYMIPTYESIK